MQLQSTVVGSITPETNMWESTAIAADVVKQGPVHHVERFEALAAVELRGLVFDARHSTDGTCQCRTHALFRHPGL